MNVTSLKDILKSLAQSLQISTSFPALILVMFNVFCIFPAIWIEVDWSFKNELLTFWITICIILLSYTLYTFNGCLIRLAEGYWTKDWKWLREFKQYLSKQQLKDYVRYHEEKGASNTGRIAAQACDTLYPSNPDDVLPTALGNVIAAFEDYSYTHYGIDAVALWPRLVPILRERKYLEFVAEQKAHFDFMLNMTLVTLICGIELLYLRLYQGEVIMALGVLFLTAFLVGLFYAGTISGAVEWGLTVRVAFDLHRKDLGKALSLKPAFTFAQEFDRWKKISKFIIYGNDRLDFDEFIYKRKPETLAH